MATDAEIRARGINFLSPQRYLQKPYEMPTEEVVEETGGGIPQTQAFTGGGGDGFSGYNSNNFNNAINNRQYNLNNPNKINQFVNKGLSFIGMQPQRSVDEMIESGEKDERPISGIPLGIGAMFARALPDKYYDQSLVDQAYTQSNMGYTGPTIFEKNNIPNKDPFGRNIRNLGLFSDTDGNYRKVQEKSIAKLDDLFAGYKDKGYTGDYAGLSLEEDEDGNYSFTGGTKAQIDNANKMHRINLARYNFDKAGLREYGTIKEKEKEQLAKENKIRLGDNLVQDNSYKADPEDSKIGREQYTGKGMAFEKQSGGVTGKGTKNERNYGGRKDGGRIGYFFGGRVNYKNGGLASIL